jgi:hypothetical protein
MQIKAIYNVQVSVLLSEKFHNNYNLWLELIYKYDNF